MIPIMEIQKDCKQMATTVFLFFIFFFFENQNGDGGSADFAMRFCTTWVN
jgi:hypothetical protein